MPAATLAALHSIHLTIAVPPSPFPYSFGSLRRGGTTEGTNEGCTEAQSAWGDAVAQATLALASADL